MEAAFEADLLKQNLHEWHHVHHVLLVKVKQKASTGSRIGEIDSLFWWEEEQRDISKGYAYKNGRITVMIFAYSLLQYIIQERY